MHEPLDSELAAYPLQDKQSSSVVYVEMGTKENKQRVRRDLSLGLTHTLISTLTRS